jgi:hypothetical protein
VSETVTVVVLLDPITLVRGDDYLEEDQRSLSFSSVGWPDLTGAAVVLTMRRRREAFGGGSDPVLLSVADVAASRVAGVGSQTVAFELVHADTVALIPGTAAGKFDVEAVLVGGSVVTLVLGVADVLEDQTR